MKQKNLIKITLFIFFIILSFLLLYETLRPFGFILMGSIFVVVSVVTLILRINFNVSSKVNINARLIRLEKINLDEGITYRPIYEYEYQGMMQTFSNPISSFRYKKTKKIGEIIELSIQKNKPSKVRVNLLSYTIIEYLAITLVLVIGVIFTVIGALSI